jgi:transposase InsO family protein
MTRAPIRRFEMTRPGELVHVDIKKLGRIPKGGGWRAHGRSKEHHGGTAKVGYAYVHSAIDGFSRLAYSEVLADEQGPTAAEFWTRAEAFFADQDITIERVLSDNGSCYRSKTFAQALGATEHTFIRPYRPQTNGKAERFNRTLLAEWAYAKTWTSEGQRNRRLAHWLHIYNHHRHHTAVGGPPISRVGNVTGHYI